jgi:isoleucyl-tRNA synthetase
MSEMQQWGIMTDWRYSYFTRMPSYQTMVLRRFSEFIRKGMVFRGDRPLFWSVET